MKPQVRRQVVRQLLSPPARGRGLKRLDTTLSKIGTPSPPARGRGLKRFGSVLSPEMFGRPPRGGVD